MSAWVIVPFAAVIAVAAAAWYGTFDRHAGERCAPRRPPQPERRQLAIAAGPAADTTAEMASMGRLRGVRPMPHSPEWTPRNAQADAAFERQYRETLAAKLEDDLLRSMFFATPGPLAAIVTDDPAGPPAVQALVYDDPVPGREYDAPLEVRPHAAEVAPYCSRPRCGDRGGHWTESHPEPSPAAEALLAERERATRLPDYALAPDAMNGHLTVDSLVDSIVFRKIGSADG